MDRFLAEKHSSCLYMRVDERVVEGFFNFFSFYSLKDLRSLDSPQIGLDYSPQLPLPNSSQLDKILLLRSLEATTYQTGCPVQIIECTPSKSER